LVLDLTNDIVTAIRWHVQQGYAGSEFLFSANGEFPVYLDSHKRPLSHHAIGRHSVASQTATGGHSIKAIQAQLGDRSEQSTHVYAHIGAGAQLRLVEALEPVSPPHVNVRSTGKKKGTQRNH
jgi:hypothetical protein